jgi:hypothetical protein
MRQKSVPEKEPATQVVKNIRRAHTSVCARSASECVAKLSLRPRANRDSVGLRGDSRESVNDGAARGWTRAILLRV